jgi:glycosyltransferase involved in cell wall biosynthesis
MKVLQLCNKSPYPPREGGPIAMHAVTQMLLENDCKVKILAVNTEKYFVNEKDVPEDYRISTSIEWVFVDLRLKLWDALKCLLTNTSYHIQRFISEDVERKLKEILTQEKYDIVQIESLFLTPYISLIREFSKAKIILRAHNVEHTIWERTAAHSKNIFKKIYLKILSKQLKSYELQVANRVDGIETLSNVDRAYFLSHGVNVPITNIPFGVDANRIQFNPIPDDARNIFFIGSMNWMPNKEGLEWFLDEIWDHIHDAYPQLKFRIAGRYMPAKLKEKAYPNVEIIGEVPDAEQFMKDNGILIVPLLSGSGVRIKIIEAMMLGKAVITTSIGLEGIDAIDHHCVMIANTPEEFLACMEEYFFNPEKFTYIGKNAAEFIRLHHNNQLIANKLLSFFKRLQE